jgi:hypothetical protein
VEDAVRLVRGKDLLEARPVEDVAMLEAAPAREAAVTARQVVIDDRWWPARSTPCRRGFHIAAPPVTRIFIALSSAYQQRTVRVA